MVATPSDALERIQAFVAERLLDRELERDFITLPFRSVQPRLDALRAEVKSLGLWAPQVPRALGGLELPFLTFARVGEALGQSPFGHYVFNCQAPDSGNMELLHAHGSAEQQSRWLEPLARGDLRSCFAMTEPEHAGSNPVFMSTRAVRDGDDYVIDGHKWFTSGADGAAFTIVMAVTEPDAPPHARASQVIVPMDAPGVTRVRNISVMGHAGDGWPTHSEMRFESVRVPVTNRIGPEGAGFALAQERLGPGRIHHGMRWLGICERAIDLSCRYAVSRELSPGQPLAAQQAVQHMLADSRAEVDAARLLVLDAARQIDTQGVHASRDAVSVLKYYVAGVLQRVLDRAIQVHGALGVTDDTPLAFWYRHERAARIYDGPDEVHKTVVAKRMLRAYGFGAR